MGGLVRYVRAGFWRRLSMLGECLGWERLTYNPGVFAQFHAAAMRNAAPLADAVLGVLPGVRSVLDVGCGTGAIAAEFQRRGLRVLGVERSERGRLFARGLGVPCRPFDLSASVEPPAEAPFDLVLSTEVAEHLPPDLADSFVGYLCSCASGSVVLTAAHPGQGGTGHVNEQPQGYWIAKVGSRGFTHDRAASMAIADRLRGSGADGYLAENVMVFRSAGRG